jgi:aminoglycoside phosphotransferase (APT) family kinase protein
MHADEAHTDVELVARLLADRLPQWSDLPVAPVPSAGTDNAIYRLGDDMAVRLPRTAGAAARLDKEHAWLPRVTPSLPLATPTPLERGDPAHGFPWAWSVYRWVQGETATLDRISDLGQAAVDVAEFIDALHRVDASDGPLPGPDNSHRGVPLALRDRGTRAAIDWLRDDLDAAAVTAAWEAALAAPEWDAPPTWIHGDLWQENLLVNEAGRICAVIDFGCLGVGDPACDLTVVWNMLTTDTRRIFRSVLDVGDATWERGRGWALSMALIALPYYRDTNPVIVRNAQRMIQQVLDG